MADPCGCRVMNELVGQGDNIDWKVVHCPRHSEAHVARLESALKNAVTVCSKPGMKDPFDNGWQWYYRLQESLTVALEGT